MIKQKHIVWTILWLVFIASGMLQPKSPVFSYIFMFSAIAISIGFGVMFTKAVKDKVFLCILWLIIVPAFSALISLLVAMIFKGNETSMNFSLWIQLGLYGVSYILLWFLMALRGDSKTVKLAMATIAVFFFIIENIKNAVIGVLPLDMLQKAFKVVINDFIKAGVNPNEAIKFAFSLMTLPLLFLSLIMLLVVFARDMGKFNGLIGRIDDKIEYWKCLLNKDYAYEKYVKNNPKYRDILGGNK